ncbi:MAG: cbb3-type cytochrome oxidase assembly protein CcoS [bacterium]|nr:cbb3-type cytochrome oxidase assembly protein CcoS [bacterium]
MTILLVLIPLGCLLLLIAIYAFLWAVRNDQFEDLELEGRRILWDDDVPAGPSRKDEETGHVR